jgi:hypothetical protein
MLKRSFKYLIIALLNLTALTLLLALWTDRLELVFHDWVRPIEFLKIVVFTIASLIVMRIAVSFFRKRAITDNRTKIKIASFLTVLVSFYLYFDYSAKLINNRIINGHLRSQIAAKIQSADGNGTTGNDLTIQEYQEICKLTSFPKLPKQATNIKYSYKYDGFLPDYYFELSYNLPKETKINPLYFQQGDFTRSQTIDILNDKVKVTYTEIEQ